MVFIIEVVTFLAYMQGLVTIKYVLVGAGKGN